MNETASQPPPTPNTAIAKGLALGLGFLLLMGTALLITLLVTRTSEDQVTAPTAIELPAGVHVVDVAISGETTLLLVENKDGQQSLIYIDNSTGSQRRVGLRNP